MATMIVRQRVRDYFDWQKIFNYSRGARKACGLSAERVYRGTHDGNDLVVVMEAADIAKAKAYACSAVRREILRRGDVVGQPLDCFVD
jgi:hypothetical protein